MGYFPGGRWREVAAGFERVWLVDHFQVHAASGDAMGEADRAVLRRLFAEEVKSIGTQASSLWGGQASSVPPAGGGAGRMHAGRTGWKPVFHLLGAHSAGNVARIPDGSLDLLYLAGEVAPDWLATALRHWMPKLRDGAVVCGDLFGLPHWREATFSLSLLVGAPDGVAADGFWWKRMSAADWKLAPIAVEVADSG